MVRFTRKRAVRALAVIAVLAVAGAAIAYFTTGGSGTGSATVATTSGVTVNQTSTITGLYPGASGSALSGNFDNSNSGKVYVASVTAAVTDVTPQTGKDFADDGLPDCTSSDFEITGTSNTPGEIAHGTGVGSWSGLSVDMIDNATSNQDNCKGATLTITYTAHAS